MGTIKVSIIGAGVFYFFIFLTGIWLKMTGRPFNGILLNIHKLIAVAAVAFLIITVIKVNRTSGLDSVEWFSAAATGLLLLGSIITGGLVSGLKIIPVFLTRLHLILPMLTVLSSAASLYLLFRTD